MSIYAVMYVSQTGQPICYHPTIVSHVPFPNSAGEARKHGTAADAQLWADEQLAKKQDINPDTFTVLGVLPWAMVEAETAAQALTGKVML